MEAEQSVPATKTHSYPETLSFSLLTLLFQFMSYSIIGFSVITILTAFEPIPDLVSFLSFIISMVLVLLVWRLTLQMMKPNADLSKLGLLKVFSALRAFSIKQSTPTKPNSSVSSFLTKVLMFLRVPIRVVVYGLSSVTTLLFVLLLASLALDYAWFASDWNFVTALFTLVLVILLSYIQILTCVVFIGVVICVLRAL